MRRALLSLVLLGCAPAYEGRRHGVTVSVDPAGLSSAEQLAVASYVERLCDADGLERWYVAVEPYPIALPWGAQVDPFSGETITTAVSYTDLDARSLGFSWTRVPDRKGKVQGNTGTEISVEDVRYELKNVACRCESGLAPATSSTRMARMK